MHWLEKAPENVQCIKGNHDVELVENMNIMFELDSKEALDTNPYSNEDAYGNVQVMMSILKEDIFWRKVYKHT